MDKNVYPPNIPGLNYVELTSLHNVYSKESMRMPLYNVFCILHEETGVNMKEVEADICMPSACLVTTFFFTRGT